MLALIFTALGSIGERYGFSNRAQSESAPPLPSHAGAAAPIAPIAGATKGKFNPHAAVPTSSLANAAAVSARQRLPACAGQTSDGSSFDFTPLRDAGTFTGLDASGNTVTFTMCPATLEASAERADPDCHFSGPFVATQKGEFGCSVMAQWLPLEFAPQWTKIPNGVRMTIMKSGNACESGARRSVAIDFICAKALAPSAPFAVTEEMECEYAWRFPTSAACGASVGAAAVRASGKELSVGGGSLRALRRAVRVPNVGADRSMGAALSGSHDDAAGGTAAAAGAGVGAGAVVEADASQWTRGSSRLAGTPFWKHAVTGETVWKDPTSAARSAASALAPAKKEEGAVPHYMRGAVHLPQVHHPRDGIHIGHGLVDRDAASGRDAAANHAERANAYVSPHHVTTPHGANKHLAIKIMDVKEGLYSGASATGAPISCTAPIPVHDGQRRVLVEPATTTPCTMGCGQSKACANAILACAHLSATCRAVGIACSESSSTAHGFIGCTASLVGESALEMSPAPAGRGSVDAVIMNVEGQASNGESVVAELMSRHGGGANTHSAHPSTMGGGRSQPPLQPRSQPRAVVDEDDPYDDELGLHAGAGAGGSNLPPRRGDSGNRGGYRKRAASSSIATSTVRHIADPYGDNHRDHATATALKLKDPPPPSRNDPYEYGDEPLPRSSLRRTTPLRSKRVDPYAHAAAAAAVRSNPRAQAASTEHIIGSGRFPFAKKEKLTATAAESGQSGQPDRISADEMLENLRAKETKAEGHLGSISSNIMPYGGRATMAKAATKIPTKTRELDQLLADFDDAEREEETRPIARSSLAPASAAAAAAASASASASTSSSPLTSSGLRNIKSNVQDVATSKQGSFDVRVAPWEKPDESEKETGRRHQGPLPHVAHKASRFDSMRAHAMKRQRDHLVGSPLSTKLKSSTTAPVPMSRKAEAEAEAEADGLGKKKKAKLNAILPTLSGISKLISWMYVQVQGFSNSLSLFPHF